MIKKIVPVLASVILLGSASLTAYADDTLDKDYIINEIWSDWWHGKGDDGLTFPEASYKHHILTDWVEKNYGDDDYEWDEIGELQYSFRDYYRDLTDEWNFNDDRDGNWTIVTDVTTYHFNLENGKWLMSDQNGDVTDSFMPFSTLEETEEFMENKPSHEIPDGENHQHRVGENLKLETANADIAESAESITKNTEKSSNGLIYGIFGVAITGTAVLVGVLTKRKRG